MNTKPSSCSIWKYVDRISTIILVARGILFCVGYFGSKTGLLGRLLGMYSEVVKPPVRIEFRGSAQFWKNPKEYVMCISNMETKKWAFVLLGIFLGGFGIHNFYLGYIGRGVTKSLISILSCGCLCWISWIWGIVEICTVRIDARGLPLES